MPNLNMRITDDEKNLLRDQAEKLGVDVTTYIKLIAKLDASTNLIRMLAIAQNVMTISQK